MKNREEYIEKLATQLKEWSAKIDDLESAARIAKADVKASYENQIRQLKEKQADSMKKLQELKGSSTEAWEILKAGAETSSWPPRDPLSTIPRISARDFEFDGVCGGSQVSFESWMLLVASRPVSR